MAGEEEQMSQDQMLLDGVQPPPAATTVSIVEFTWRRRRFTGWEAIARALAKDYERALAAIENYQDERRLLEYNIVEMRAALELIANDHVKSCDFRLCNHPACALVTRYRTESKDALLRVGGTVHRG